MLSVNCKDVVMGRGSGTQNHCGNVTYRKLVFLNKELYATSSKFDKLKISKAIVAAVREFGGHFIQADDKRGGLYYDIGDKRAWDKTSQALREGQAEIRARLAEEDPSGMSKVAEYKQVISEQTFFAYACRMLESLYHPMNGDSGISACGQLCPHARRRQALNQLGAHPVQIHHAMQSLTPPPLPPPQAVQQQQQTSQGYSMQQVVQPSYNMNTVSPQGGTNIAQITPSSSMQPYQHNMNPIEPLPYYAPAFAPASAPPESFGSLDPLPYAPEPPNAKTMPGGSISTEVTAPDSILNSLAPSEITAPTSYQSSFEPLPYHTGSDSLQKPAPLSKRETTGGSVFSLRKFCSEDFEMSSAEGQALMEQLNHEVDNLIRRKSCGLIQIDTTEAFEDLVFEEDSMALDDPKESPPLNREKRESSSSSSAGRNSGYSQVSQRSGRYSGLSFKDDISLMNMSILTLDEKDESSLTLDRSGNSLAQEKEVTAPEGGGSTPKSIIRPTEPSLQKDKDTRKRSSRVSFAGKNISLMAMNDRSFSQLLESLSDGGSVEAAPERSASEKSIDSEHSISRKMGFPMRKTVAERYKATADLPAEICKKMDGPVSTLTISEDAVMKSERELRSEMEFSRLAGQVENTSGVGNSLKLDGSLSNVSAMHMSNMSLSLSDIDTELLK